MRRVFVLWRHPLFYESVRLLLRHPKVTLVGATSDYGAGKNQISALKPDVVIVEREDEGDIGTVDPVDLLQKGSTVMSLGLADNELSVYQRQQRTVASSDELLGLVLAGATDDQE